MGNLMLKGVVILSISDGIFLPVEEALRMETGWAPRLGQVTLCSTADSDRKAADSSLDPCSQPSHLKHAQALQSQS